MCGTWQLLCSGDGVSFVLVFLNDPPLHTLGAEIFLRFFCWDKEDKMRECFRYNVQQPRFRSTYRQHSRSKSVSSAVDSPHSQIMRKRREQPKTKKRTQLHFYHSR